MEAQTKPLHPEPKNLIRGPFIPIQASKKIIAGLSISSIALCITSCVLGLTLAGQIQKAPWVIASTENGYETVGLDRQKISRRDLEQYVNFVIPTLYGHLNGEAKGLESLRGLVNQNILDEQKKEVSTNSASYKNDGVSEFVVLTGINPETVVINNRKKMAYVEVVGSVLTTKNNKTKKTDSQWRCVFYLVNPAIGTSAASGGKNNGNRFGIYLQQIVEQPPGTLNPDSPKPTREDMEEYLKEKNNDQK
jgi:hypothetical protein